MNNLVFEIREIPDLTLIKYQTLAENGTKEALSRHIVFLRQWHGTCLELKLSMHLLYLFDAEASQGYRLRLFFILQGEQSSLHIASELIKNNPLSQFFEFEKALLPDVTFKSGATSTKAERMDQIFNARTGASKPFHYVPSWTVDSDSRLIELIKMLHSFGSMCDGNGINYGSCAFRADFYPAQESEKTRASFDPLLRALKGEFDIKLTKESYSTRQDGHISEVCRVYEDWLTTVETTPHFRINLYTFAPMQYQAKLLLNSLGSEVVEEGNCFIAPISQENGAPFLCSSRMEPSPQTYSRYKTEASLAEWATTYSINEAASFFKLPILYDGETIELPKETIAPKQLQGLELGHDANGYDTLFPLEKLTKHGFFTGMPGSGKTNTMLRLATLLHDRGIPFLVLEPAKKEYRNLLSLSKMDDIYLFSPHIQSFFPLQVNPLEFPRNVRVSEHISALLEVFRGSFFLEGAVFRFLSNAIVAAYEDKGWSLEEVNKGDACKFFPTLGDVCNHVKKEIERSYYDSEIKGNARSFLEVRLRGLMERDAGELFDASTSTLHPDEWLTKSAIVELEVLDEESKNFFILLLCQYITETLKANPVPSHEMPLRHALFIEEAHNIIASDSHQGRSEIVDPKIASTAYIVKMLAEVRALGEAIIIADQLPTALATEVTKNTGLKIVHRLASMDDREVIGNSISATPSQIEVMGDLSTGEAFMHYEGVKKPFIVRIEKWRSTEQVLDVSIDEELANAASGYDTLREPIRKSIQNWVEKNISTLSSDISSHLSRCELFANQLDDKLNEQEKVVNLHDALLKARASYERRKIVWRMNDGFLDSERECIENMLDMLEEQIRRMRM